MPLPCLRSSRMEPVPERLPTLTSKIVPLVADTPTTVPEAVPVVVNTKAPGLTPLTLLLKVARKTTPVTPAVIVLVAGLNRVIVIRGGPWIFKMNIEEDGLMPPAFDEVAKKPFVPAGSATPV